MEVIDFQLSISYPKRWYVSKFGKLSSGHITEKVNFYYNPKKGNAKDCSNYWTIALISHDSKIKLKILQARLQQ